MVLTAKASISQKYATTSAAKAAKARASSPAPRDGRGAGVPGEGRLPLDSGDTQQSWHLCVRRARDAVRDAAGGPTGWSATGQDKCVRGRSSAPPSRIRSIFSL